MKYSTEAKIIITIEDAPMLEALKVCVFLYQLHIRYELKQTGEDYYGFPLYTITADVTGNSAKVQLFIDSME